MICIGIRKQSLRERDVSSHAHGSIIHNRETVEAAPVSTEVRMGKQNVVYICSNMEEPGGLYAK